MWLRKISLILLCSFLVTACLKHETSFQDTHGNVVQLSQLKGKWVIVNYWAAWCPSCVEEIPELNHFYQNNLHKDLVLYGVSYDKLSTDDLQKMIQKVNIAFPVLTTDPQQAWHLDTIDAIPVTYIIDPYGQVVKKINGPSTEESLTDALESAKKNENL